jgi:methyl-accepting chemotaxis protein
MRGLHPLPQSGAAPNACARPRGDLDMKSLPSLKLAVKIPLIITALSLLTAAATGALNYFGAKASVEAESRSKLESVLSNRSAALESWLKSIDEDIATQAANPTVREAIRAFRAAHAELGPDAGAHLQSWYIDRNPHPTGKKEELDVAADGSAFSAAHAGFHPYFRTFLRARGYYDIFLFDANGDVLYTVYKERDFATNVERGQWSKTDLGEVFRAAKAAAGTGQSAFSDFRPYAPSADVPASFMAAPVLDEEGRFMGAIGFQMPIERLDSLMHNNAGLGETGETYIVGADHLMRSDFRFSKESTILKRKVDTAPIVAAFEGKSGVMSAQDYRKVPVVSAFRPIEFKGVKWAVLAEQDEAELLAPVAALRNQLFMQLAASFALLVGVGFFVGRSISKPIAALGGTMTKIAHGDFKLTVPGLKRGDELGDMAKTLDQFRADLGKAEETNRVALFKGSAFDGSSVAMMMIDRDAKVTFTNEAAQKLFASRKGDFAAYWPGFDPAKMVGASIDIHPNDPGRQKQILADPARLPYSSDLNIGAGKFSLSISGIFDLKGAFVGATLEWADVTAARSNSGILAAVDRTQAVIEFTLDGQIITANANFCNAIGYALEEIVGKHHGLFVEESYRKSAEYAEFWRKLKSGESVISKFKRIRKNGAAIWIEASYNAILDGNGKPFKVVKFATDVTELELAKQSADAERAEKSAAQAQVVEGLASGLGRLAEGDLTARLDTPFAEDYEQLRANFNEATAKLEDAMKAVVLNTKGMFTGVQEISQASDDLSKRTENQAASLEETAAALDEVTATVKQTASGAATANNVVNETRSDAEASGLVVRDAVVAMGEIEKSSTQISQIIGVIDEIAFQTNLLALNAGVEAARAGDAGRGFAVVASEVRALAQRSSDAAKEIKGLISASSQHVGQGVKLVGQAGKALEQIVGRVTQVAKLVSDIAASAQEQATGLAEINTAVNQMDQVTQQNAAMVEQSTAAAHSLRQEAEELSRLVSRFKTDAVTAQQVYKKPAERQSVAEQRDRAKAFASASRGGAARKVEPAAQEDDWKEF